MESLEENPLAVKLLDNRLCMMYLVKLPLNKLGSSLNGRLIGWLKLIKMKDLFLGIFIGACLRLIVMFGVTPISMPWSGSHMLCILTSFRVLRAPESWSKHFFFRFQPFWN